MFAQHYNNIINSPADSNNHCEMHFWNRLIGRFTVIKHWILVLLHYCNIVFWVCCLITPWFFQCIAVIHLSVKNIFKIYLIFTIIGVFLIEKLNIISSRVSSGPNLLHTLQARVIYRSRFTIFSVRRARFTFVPIVACSPTCEFMCSFRI